MSIFYNDYWKLRAQNNDQIAKLSGKNWKPLNEMMQYISSFNVSLFELEVIKKDLIGAALEADIEQTALEEKTGMSGKEFCDGLIQSGMKKKRFERLLLGISYIILWVFSFYTIELFMIRVTGPDYGVSVSDICFAVCVCLVFYDNMLGDFLFGRMIYADKKKLRILKGTICLGIILVFAVLQNFLFSSVVYVLWGNKWAIFGILLVAAAAAFFGRNYYWNRCAQKYNWK